MLITQKIPLVYIENMFIYNTQNVDKSNYNVNNLFL